MSPAKTLAIARSRIVSPYSRTTLLDLLRRRRVEIEVERGHAPLDVAVPDDHVVAVRLDRRRRELEQLLEQLGREAVARQREVLELERVRHPADAVDLLHHQELPLHGRAVGLLRVPELVLDHLQHVRVRGQVEDVHHEARACRAPRRRRPASGAGGGGGRGRTASCPAWRARRPCRAPSAACSASASAGSGCSRTGRPCRP